MRREGSVDRKTRETDISVCFSPDGVSGQENDIRTGIGFFDHMLNSFAVHGGFGLSVRAEGDLGVDCHHTVEDVGIVLGQAFRQALGDRRGIRRFAHAYVPMDETLAFAAVDVSGRPYLVFSASFTNPSVGAYDTCMTEEFFRAFAVNAGVTLHLRCEYGKNDHHITEALFKAFALALRSAAEVTGGEIPSAKGVL